MKPANFALIAKQPRKKNNMKTFTAFLLTILMGATLLPFFIGLSLFMAAHPVAVNWQRDILGLKSQQIEAALTANYLTGFASFEDLGNGSILYTPNELSHLQDVRHVMDRLRKALGGFFLAWVILTIATFIFFKRRALFYLSRSIRLATMLTVAMLLAVSSSFAYFFGQMHSFLFPQGNFIFPPDSLLIQLFPENFFRNIAVGIFVLTILWLFMALGLVKFIEKR